MPPDLWLPGFKLVISVAVVLGLSLVAERVSARTAGLLSGYPLGTAITLAFIGIEISPDFAARSAIYTLAGFTSTLALGIGYWLCGREPGTQGVIAGILGGLTFWLLAVLFLAQFSFSRWSGTLLTLVAMAACMGLYRAVPEANVARRRLAPAALLSRALFAAGMIFGITTLAHLLPASWAGLLAAFPVTMFPFLVILHLTHGPAPVATAIKHYPAGLGSLLLFALTVSFTYARLGVGIGTLLGFIAATAWLWGFGWLRRRIALRT